MWDCVPPAYIHRCIFPVKQKCIPSRICQVLKQVIQAAIDKLLLVFFQQQAAYSFITLYCFLVFVSLSCLSQMGDGCEDVAPMIIDF